MEMKTDAIKRTQLADTLVTILVLGSIWGLLEVVLGGALRATGFPYRAAVLTGLGMGLLGIAIGAFRKPTLLPAIAFVTVLCKQLVVPVLRVSVLCKANSCLAVMLEGLALAGVVLLAGRWLHRGSLPQAAGGVSAALLSAGAFYFAGLRVAPCQYLLSFNRPGGFAAFMVAEGLLWAAFSGLLFPVGYWLGAQVGPVLSVREAKGTSVYYAASAVIVIGCWVVSALAITAGL